MGSPHDVVELFLGQVGVRIGVARLVSGVGAEEQVLQAAAPCPTLFWHVRVHKALT